MDPSPIASASFSALLGVVAAVLAPTIILKISGWNELCRRFPPRVKRYDGTWINYQSLVLRPVHFGNCVSFGVSNEGLFLRLSPIFFPFAPQMLIPWQSVASIGNSRALFANHLVITLTDGKVLAFSERPAIASALRNQVLMLGLERIY